MMSWGRSCRFWLELNKKEIISLPSSETVKEPHFLDFRQGKISKLQVNHANFRSSCTASEPLERSGQAAQIENENCRLPQKHAIIMTWESWSGNRSMKWLVQHSH